MGEFFRGWKRKIGLVTLVMALMFMAGWVRSVTIRDVAIVGFRTATFSIKSTAQCLEFGGITAKEGQRKKMLFIRRSDTIESLKSSTNLIDVPSEGDWQFAFGPFFIDGEKGMMGFPSDLVPTPSPAIPYSAMSVQMPYWSIAVPMTLISLWLLLSKPHKSNQEKIGEPTAIEGAKS